MPPKIRELIAALNRAGFSDRGGDAQAYQVRAVRNAVKEAQE